MKALLIISFVPLLVWALWELLVNNKKRPIVKERAADISRSDQLFDSVYVSKYIGPQIWFMFRGDGKSGIQYSSRTAGGVFYSTEIPLSKFLIDAKTWDYKSLDDIISSECRHNPTESRNYSVLFYFDRENMPKLEWNGLPKTKEWHDKYEAARKTADGR